jgi:hypothetical protein
MCEVQEPGTRLDWSMLCLGRVGRVIVHELLTALGTTYPAPMSNLTSKPMRLLHSISELRNQYTAPRLALVSH